MELSFTSQFFAGNRARLRELFTGRAPIVVTANGLLQRGGDSSYAFAQDASFWYLTGINQPDIILVMDKSKEYLIVPERDASREAFDGALQTDQFKQTSGIKTVLDNNAGWNQLSSRLKKVKHVATVAPAPVYIEHYGIYSNPSRATLLQRLRTINQEIEILDISSHLSRQRMIKQPAEIAAIKQAINITIQSINQSLKPSKLKSYKHEFEIEAELTRGFRKRGASGHAFDPIVASGKSACILHNTANNGVLEKDQMIVVDVGAEFEGYAADITRTVINGKPSRRQQAVHAAVLEVQTFAINLLKPGIMLKDYEDRVVEFMGEKLRSLGLIKTINHDNVRQYFPHATSHFLGLNVHDVGDYNRPLEAGIVLTVEPGIYIHEEGIGVRIEDDILITPIGNRILTNKLSRELS
jgi:Xaa-Pro aminopeptidase